MPGDRNVAALSIWVIRVPPSGFFSTEHRPLCRPQRNNASLKKRKKHRPRQHNRGIKCGDLNSACLSYHASPSLSDGIMRRKRKSVGKKGGKQSKARGAVANNHQHLSTPFCSMLAQLHDQRLLNSCHSGVR